MERKNLFEQVGSEEALKLLKEGNKRYLNNQPSGNHDPAGVRAGLASKGQVPFAVILGCADSRVPPEIIFDAGAGQLFVVRTAGNVADKVAVGSIEFAVEQLKARLIVVLGHDKCGAVAAAISGGDFRPNLTAIISEIKPSVDKLREFEKDENFLAKCEDENISNTVEKLKKSDILGKYLADGSLEITGAKYDLESGVVTYIESL